MVPGPSAHAYGIMLQAVAAALCLGPRALEISDQ